MSQNIDLSHNYFNKFNNENTLEQFDTQSYSIKDIFSKSQHNQSFSVKQKRAVTNQQMQRPKFEQFENPIEAQI